MSSAEEAKGYMRDVLVRVRLDARHGIPPMSLSVLKTFCLQNAVHAASVRQAEQEGRALLASGARCMCQTCEANLRGLDHKERLRIHYAARRHAQLQAIGIDSTAERERLIQAEIDAGAALQGAPTTITRSKPQ